MTSPTPLAATATADAVRPAGPAVRHLRQILLWPLRRDGGQPHRTPWQVLRDLGEASAWREVGAEYTGDSARFHERHYHEFVTFLPCVQRILYGEGRKAAAPGPRPATATPTRRCACSAARTSPSCASSPAPAMRR